MLDSVICRGGNLLLNIGPDPDGHVPDKVKALFRALGEIARANGEAIFGARAGIWQPVGASRAGLGRANIRGSWGRLQLPRILRAPRRPGVKSAAARLRLSRMRGILMVRFGGRAGFGARPAAQRRDAK